MLGHLNDNIWHNVTAPREKLNEEKLSKHKKKRFAKKKAGKQRVDDERPGCQLKKT